MSDNRPSIEKLEKQIRVLQRKLERSEWHRIDLENQHDRDQHLYRRLHADLEAARRAAEVEAALERVRTKAMAMRTPEDLSGISETVFTELKALGFTDLRNTEIIINHDTKASVTSYYYSDYGVTGVVDVDYSTNPTVAAWAREMQKADDAFAEVVIAEDEMEAWRVYRLSLGYVPDPKLDQASTVYYYSYSIGLGALSISSFQPVHAGQLNVLEQFRHVFNLAYQRYVDIARAEAQAREAQVQLALERIRAQSTLMQHSSELVATSAVFHEQLLALGVPTEFSYVWLPDEAAGKHQFWTTWTTGEDGEPVHHSRAVTYDLDRSEPYTAACFAAWKGDDPIHVERIPPGKVEHFFATWAELVGGAGHLRSERFPDGIYYAEGYMQYGCFGINIRREPTEAERDLLRRFAVEFERAYTRFLDLRRAEAQAREAEIEASLERVRARAMAMHSSDDLSDATAVVFTELERLGITTLRCGINIIHDSGVMDLWTATATSEDSDLRVLGRLDTSMHPMLNAIYAAWKAQQPYYTRTLAGEEMQTYYQALKEAPDYAFPKDANPTKSHVAYIFFFPEGGLFAFAQQPLAEESIQILQRFAAVFALTYRRYLDLKNAEEQAREAQINLAVERVRARALAMFRSEEILDVVFKLKEEVMGLDIPGVAAATIFLREAGGNYRMWDLSSLELTEEKLHLPLDISFRLEDTDPDLYVRRVFADAGHYFLVIQDENDLQRTFQFLRDHDKVIQADEADQFVKATGLKRLYHPCVPLSNGRLCIDLLEPPAAEIESILTKMGAAFDLAYKRFEDLKKAEEQLRETQIEAALEKVRSRSLAMHKSEEVQEVVTVVVQKLMELGVVLDAGEVIICTYFKESKDVMQWIASPDFSYSGSYLLPYFDHPVFNESWDFKNSGIDYSSKAYSYEEKKSFFEYAFEHSDFKNFPDEFKKWVFEHKQYALSFAWAKNSAILIPSHTGTSPSESDKQILIRFARVFEQAYIRFMDLQKAEAQAREAQIEAALERVRAKSMAMHKSEELPEIANLLFQQIQSIGIPVWSTAFNIFSRDKSTVTCNVSSEGQLQPSFTLPLTEEKSFKEWYDAIESKKTLFVQELGGKDLEQHYEYLFTLPGVKDAAKPLEDEGIALPTYQINHICPFEHGFLLFITYEKVPDAHPVFRRFTSAFQQTYTRFLDLQKAEAQAREAQIEAALERVRSRTMAMQKSEELSETSALLFDQIKELGIETWTSGFNIWEDDGRACIGYNATPAGGLGVPIRLPLTEDPFFKTIHEARKRDEEFLVFESEGESLAETYRYMFTLPVVRDVMQGIVDSGFDLPEYQVTHCCFFSHGHLMFITLEPRPDAWEVFKRFTRVFEQTYTRFLDLKKSEAQAQQARRQASLDRVRAEIASMRTADDLEHITPLIWRELTTLGVPFFRCGVFIIDEADEAMQVYLTNPEGKALAVLRLGFDDAPLVEATVAHWRQEAVYTEEWDAAQMRDWTRFLQERGHIETSTRYLDDEAPPEHLALHFVPFAQGMLYVGSREPLPAEALDTVQALADAFAVAYARYEDFQRLEAAKAEVEATLSDLQAAQRQLIHAEKMASLGSLTAGIAHEIKNPLNFINNFAELNEELAQELHELLGDDAAEDVQEVLADLQRNARVIVQHGKRADGIVRSMLDHSRGGSGERRAVDLNALVDEYLTLAFHGKRAQTADFNAEIKKQLSIDVGEVEIVPQEIGRVLLNLIGNAFDAVYERAVAVNGVYVPTVTVCTQQVNDQVEIRVCDNGPGIPPEVKEKIFEPFFTTKPTGTGTGLGLSLSYDIVTQGHGGTLTVESEAGEGATFIVTLPMNHEEAASSS